MRVVTIPGSGQCFDLDRPGAVTAWNRALNRRYAMENLRRHPRGIVRAIEARRRARIASMVPRFGRALDLGAEDGSLAQAWSGKGGRVVLLDLDPAMLRRGSGPRVAADAARLPFARASFDLVVMSAILEHMVEPVRLLAETRRVLQPGGRIVAYVPWDGAVVFLKRWAHRLGFRLGALHAGPAPGHLRIFDRERLERLFARVFARRRIHLDPFSLGFYIEAGAV